jgi:hypothetical protein
MGRPLEEEMLTSYLMDRFQGGKWWVHVRLGALPDIQIPGLDVAKARLLAMPGLPELDAIAVLGADVYLIEAKVLKEWDNLGKMLVYKWLLPQTAGWEAVNMATVKMLLVLCRASQALKNCAVAMGVLVDVYNTPATAAFLQTGYPRKLGL